MKTINIQHQLIEIYLRLLATLNRESKLVLFEQFEKLVQQENTVTPSFFTLFGALKDDTSAEEMIDNIRNASTFNRIIEPL
jgi:hypothetical protein